MKKKSVQLAIGLVISVFFLWLAFRNVDVGELVGAFEKTNWLWAIPFLLITIGNFYYRSIRWRILLGPAKWVPSSRLFGPLMIGFGFNNIFPARAGEFARPLALMKQDDVPYGAGFSSVLLERLVDMLCLLALFILMPLYFRIDPNIEQELWGFRLDAGRLEELSWSMSLMALVLTGGLLTFLIPPVKRFYLSVLHWLPLIPAFIKEKLESFVHSFTTGLSTIKSPFLVTMVAIHTLVIWGTIALSYQVMSWGFPGFEITFAQAVGFMVVTCVAISIPSSPGYWGPFELGGMVALMMVGVPEGPALAFTMLVHFLQWGPTTLIGLFYAGKLHVSAKEAEHLAEEAPVITDAGSGDSVHADKPREA